REASGREEALRLVRAEQPDLVVVDIELADVDGVHLVLDLRAQPVPRRVVLRARPDIEPETRALARALGTGFVGKPANPQALLAALERALADPVPLAAGVGASDAPLRAMIGLVRHLAAQRQPLEAAREALALEIRKRLQADEQISQSVLDLRDQALRDPLTGLYNRRYLDASLAREESRARRRGQPVAVLMIDVDHFKRFNDSYGHAAGDEVLRRVGRYIESHTRGEDIAARYGGDEFTLVMAKTPLEAALPRARALCAGAQALSVEFGGRSLGRLALSVGVAAFPEHGESLQAVLQVADEALRRCKALGRGRVEVAA
ncbi:MAG: diguanylate cyclase, partial [Sphingomonadaceae bacterium]